MPLGESPENQWTTVSKSDGLEPDKGSIDKVLLLTDMQKEDLAMLPTDVQSKSVLEYKGLDTITIAGERDKWSRIEACFHLCKNCGQFFESQSSVSESSLDAPTKLEP